MTKDAQTFLSGLTIGFGLGIIISHNIRKRLDKWRAK